MKYKNVSAFAPASVANVCCGFDIMGFAVDDAGDKVSVSQDSTNEFPEIILSGKYGHLISPDKDKNTAGVAISAFLKHIGRSDQSFKIELQKNLPLGSGLGSSASSSVAAVIAINHLFGSPLTAKELLPFAMEGERIACGSAHADNVAPSLLGGFVLINNYEPLEVTSLDCPDNLYCAVVHPQVELHTNDARKIMDKDIPLTTAIKQCANVAGFVSGLWKQDPQLIGRCMEDLFAEPKRTQLIPGFQKVKREALKAGAIGCGISGSGPSVFALCIGKDNAQKAAEGMQYAFNEMYLDSEIYISSLQANGAYIINAN